MPSTSRCRNAQVGHCAETWQQAQIALARAAWRAAAGPDPSGKKSSGSNCWHAAFSTHPVID